MFKLTKAVMPCLLLPCIAALIACNPPPKDATMRNPSPVPEAVARDSRETSTQGHGSADPGPTGRGAPGADSPAEAQGRRTLSTAFVMVGPDGHLTVELRDGTAMVLRDLVMRPRDYCGVQVLGGSAGTRYCGGYGEIAAARPGGGPAPDAPNPMALDPAKRE